MEPHRRIAAQIALLATMLVLAGCGTLNEPGRGGRAPSPAPLPAPASPAPQPLPMPAVPSPAPLPEPAPAAAAKVQTGIASWYGKPFHGRRTASGEVFNMHALTAAHRTMPLPSYAHVRNPANGREVVVRINDRGPFTRGRIIDLSYAAAKRLGIDGIAPVEVTPMPRADLARAD